MERDEVKKEVLTCLKNIGVMVDESEGDNLNVQDYIEDSIMFITFIIELENHFDIEIADEYLLPEKVNNLQNLVELVNELKVR